MTILTVGQVVKKIVSKTLPIVAAAALLFPASRKLGDSAWRKELGMSYEIAGQGFGATFFLLIGLLEAAMAVLILWPKTRVPAGLTMAGFFVGALLFNLVLRVDAASLPEDRATLSTLVPLDTSHILIGLGVAFLWRSEGQPSHLWTSPGAKITTAKAASRT